MNFVSLATSLGECVAQEIRRRMGLKDGSRVRLLDVGVYDGVSRRYIEAYPESSQIDFRSGRHLSTWRRVCLQALEWLHHKINLLEGMPSL